MYGDFTYLDDGTGSAFQWVGYPTGGACTPSCNPGYLGADDYVLPARGTLTRLTPLITWKPLAGHQSYFVIVSKDANFSNIADYAFTQVPAYSPRTMLTPTTYSDETTLYYWAVLPAIELQRQRRRRRPAVGGRLRLSRSSRCRRRRCRPTTARC